MAKKLLWDDVYKDFRSRYPNLRKSVIHWHPCDYATIELYFEDGTKGRYDYLSRSMRLLREA